jgi:cobaltochelatase CobN
MDDAGVYEKLADMDSALKEYYAARQMQSAQVKVLRKRLFDLAEESRIIEDMRVTRAQWDEAPDAHIDKLHLWIEELKNSAVTDGLHVFGQVPQGKLYENMLRMLTRVRSGNVPPLNDAILTAYGYDAEAIKSRPTEWVGACTASVLYDRAVETARVIIGELHEASYSGSAVDAILRKDIFLQGSVRR